MKELYHVEGTVHRGFVGQITYTICFEKPCTELDIHITYDYAELRYKDDQVPASVLEALHEELKNKTALPKMKDALEKFDCDTLIESILATKELGPMHCLSIAFGVYNIRVARTMLANLRTLYNQLMILTPYQRLTGFEAIPMADASLYQMPLIANKKDPTYARDGFDNATAAIFTIMETIPLGNLWCEKHRALMKRVREVAII